MPDTEAGAVEAQYQAGLRRVREGMDQLWALYRDLEQRDSQASLRATLLKLLHDLDEVLLQETTPPPPIDPDGGTAGIAPILEESDQPTEPESGG